MSAVATPWDALLHLPPARRTRSDADASRPTPTSQAKRAGRASTKLDGLLAVLGERDHGATTLVLSVCTDLTPRQIWGLLKHPLEIGQVQFEAGRWKLNRDFPGADVVRAIALLKTKGYRVVRPDGRAAS